MRFASHGQQLRDLAALRLRFARRHRFTRTAIAKGNASLDNPTPKHTPGEDERERCLEQDERERGLERTARARPLSRASRRPSAPQRWRSRAERAGEASTTTTPRPPPDCVVGRGKRVSRKRPPKLPPSLRRTGAILKRAARVVVRVSSRQNVHLRVGECAGPTRDWSASLRDGAFVSRQRSPLRVHEGRGRLARGARATSRAPAPQQSVKATLGDGLEISARGFRATTLAVSRWRRATSLASDGPPTRRVGDPTRHLKKQNERKPRADPTGARVDQPLRAVLSCSCRPRVGRQRHSSPRAPRSASRAPAPQQHQRASICVSFSTRGTTVRFQDDKGRWRVPTYSSRSRGSLEHSRSSKASTLVSTDLKHQREFVIDTVVGRWRVPDRRQRRERAPPRTRSTRA